MSGGQYTASFDGNADTDASGDGGPYTISNLFIDRTTGNYAGLFAYLNDGGSQTVEDVGLVNVDITVSTTTNSHVFVGGLAGNMISTIEDSYTTGRVRAGESATNPVTFTFGSNATFVGGLVGRSLGSITSSYSLADVTGYSTGTQDYIFTYAGGLAGYAGGYVSASFAGGGVYGNTVALNAGYVYAGGLVGRQDGNISASYARGDVSASYDATVTTGITGESYAGGLVGRQDGNITASFSTGAAMASGDGVPKVGGLVGGHAGYNTTNSYWDTEASGVSTSATGAGTTTSALQTPTAYGTGSSIYANWDVNVDGQAGNDDPWDFGTAGQYPALKYGTLDPAQQRATTTLSLSTTTIWERALTSPSRVNSAELTATLSATWNEDVVVTLPTSSAYTLGTSTLTIAAGETIATTSADGGEQLRGRQRLRGDACQGNDHTNTTWVIVGTTTTITINDDDELTKPTGLRLSVDGTKIRADWTAVTGATGYRVEWNTSDSWTGSITGSATISSGSTTHYVINPSPALSADTRYYVRVLPTKSGVDEPPSDVVSATTRASAGRATTTRITTG